MSKKPQPVKEAPKIKEVEEENDPFLKTLQKKVRNINKKLTEIQELEGKDNLKPEQIQKVNRKQSLHEERAKVQEIATLFRESYNENAALYRNNQLKELEVLARSLVIFQSGLKVPEQDKLSLLWKAIMNSGIVETPLNESIATLTSIFKDFANDRKLQKGLAAHVDTHGHAKVQTEKKVQKNPVIVAKEEAKLQVKQEPIKQIEATKLQPILPEPKIEQKVLVQEQVTAISQEVTATKIQPIQEKKYKEDKSSRAPKDQEPREKKQFKPKYEAKKPEQDDESSEEQPQVRNFHLDQVHKLEEEGFIVVSKAKPKPKPKDTKELLNAHNQQHGKKFHPHHHASNH